MKIKAKLSKRRKKGKKLKSCKHFETNLRYPSRKAKNIRKIPH